jgi:Ala-tRNA(Pro) deacylase
MAASLTDGPNAIQVYDKICALLDSNNVEYKSVTHEVTLTSEDSARARGEDLSIGGKAILMKFDDTFALFVLSAAKKINSKRIKEHLKAKKIRFSTSQELADLCGLVPGSVPPFGEPILPVKLYVDNSILLNEKIAFNAGSLTRSIIFETKNYIEVAKPEIFDFSE